MEKVVVTTVSVKLSSRAGTWMHEVSKREGGGGWVVEGRQRREIG